MALLCCVRCKQERRPEAAFEYAMGKTQSLSSGDFSPTNGLSLRRLLG